MPVLAGGCISGCIWAAVSAAGSPSGGSGELSRDCCTERRRRSGMLKLMRRIRRVRPVLPPPSAFTGFRFPWEVIVLAVRSMPLSLAGDLVGVDLGWAVVELAVVGGAFEAVVVSAVSFDHPGVCSVSSRGVGWVGGFVGGFGECGGECFRGESPPGW